MQLLQNAGRRHLMMSDTDEAVWSDGLMPLELLMQPETGMYLAVIDRKNESIGECMGSGAVSASFGSVTLDGSTETVTLKNSQSSTPLSMQPGTDVHAVVLDKQSGEVLYERAVKL